MHLQPTGDQDSTPWGRRAAEEVLLFSCHPVDLVLAGHLKRYLLSLFTKLNVPGRGA